MSDDGKAVFYGIDDPETLVHEDRNECIEDYIDSTYPEPWPETVTVVSYRRMTVSLSDTWAESVVEDVIERLDEDYGGDDYEQAPEAMDALRFAAREFRDAVVSAYVPCAYEPCGEEVVDAKAWVAEHCPHWLADSKREGGA